MEQYKKRNRDDLNISPNKKPALKEEKELVLKLQKDELFDQNIILPHAELNSTVYNSVDTFVEKYKGDELTIMIMTKPLTPVIQDLFREVYRSHYQDEYNKVKRYLKRHYNRVVILLLIAVFTFVMSTQINKIIDEETIFSYLIGNVSCFCLWEVGYSQFSTRDVIDQRDRVSRALKAKIEFD